MKIQLDWSLRTVALSAVFVVLGSAAVYWLVFAEGLHSFRRDLRQESRHAEVVGAKPLPDAPVVVEIIHKRQYCAAIDRAEIDGDDLTIWWHNGCKVSLTFLALVVKGKAPDGTVVAGSSDYVLVGEITEPGETREFREKIAADPRVVKLQIWLDR
jgi:hypothetical protein